MLKSLAVSMVAMAVLATVAHAGIITNYSSTGGFVNYEGAYARPITGVDSVEVHPSYSTVTSLLPVYVNFNTLDFSAVTGTITNATVTFVSGAGWATANNGYWTNATAYNVTETWTSPPAGTFFWNSGVGPATDAASAARGVLTNPTTTVIDITAMAQAWQADPTSFHGVCAVFDGNAMDTYEFPGDTSVYGAPMVTLTTEVPEPATLSLIALGGLALLRRRK